MRKYYVAVEEVVKRVPLRVCRTLAEAQKVCNFYAGGTLGTWRQEDGDSGFWWTDGRDACYEIYAVDGELS